MAVACGGGAISIAFLEALEAKLAREVGRLSDWFDLIGGPSTGVIITGEGRDWRARGRSAGWKRGWCEGDRVRVYVLGAQSLAQSNAVGGTKRVDGEGYWVVRGEGLGGQPSLGRHG